MDRNSNARFELAPQAAIERSTIRKPFNVKTSFNVGELIPFMIEEVVPGSTYDIETSKVMRLQTLLTPVMDNLFLDTYYFFVPNRLVWEHWREFMGENSTSAWIPTVEYSVPTISAPADEGWQTGTLADYFGLPINEPFCEANALPFRAYSLICNEWFRDENLMQPLNIPKGDANVQGTNGDNYIVDCAKGGKPFIACKTHDYYTSALPSPQKGEDVSLLDGLAPIVTGDTIPAEIFGNTINHPKPTQVRIFNNATGQFANPTGNRDLRVNDQYNLDTGEADGTGHSSNPYLFNNLYASLGNTEGMTINYLRRAFAIQRMLEKDARGGTRYIELIKSHFGVESPDARMQRPEYLGGNRCPLNIEQVTQTAPTNATSPLGSQAGWSQTNDYSNDVHKSFTEHGYIIGLMVARYDHTYQQGMEKHWLRRNRYDYYWPALAHLGEQAVYQEEIYPIAAQDYKKVVFGYQEAWAEYRYKPNYVTGEMRSAAKQSLDVWHFADWYETRPLLSADWIKEDKSNIDRTLAIPSSTSNQIFGDVLVNMKATLPMPLYSIPGLIDHF